MPTQQGADALKDLKGPAPPHENTTPSPSMNWRRERGYGEGLVWVIGHAGRERTAHPRVQRREIRRKRRQGEQLVEGAEIVGLDRDLARMT